MAMATQGRGNPPKSPGKAGNAAGAPGGPPKAQAPAGSYGIGTPARTCTRTGREIATGERYLSALTQSAETGEYTRLDFAANAWGGVQDVPPGLMLLGVWRGVMPAVDAKPRLLIDDASLMDLFEQAVEAIAQDSGAPAEREAFLFVLTLILVRKRLLVVEKSEPDAMVVRERARSSEPRRLIEVRDPHLDEASIADLAAMLEGVMASGPAGQGSPS